LVVKGGRKWLCNREEWKKLLRTARNRHILYMLTERIIKPQGTTLVIWKCKTGPYPATTQPSSYLHTTYKVRLEMILPHFSSSTQNVALTCSGSSYSFGNIYHIDNDGLDAITLALNLGAEARHLVAVECVAHAAVYVHTPHFED